MPKIELKQEGIVRLAGYQCSQWIATSTGVTNPLSNAPLFVIRNTEGLESFERIATPQDFVAYAENELKYFEAKNTGGDAALDAQVGDLITITSSITYWLQADAPYTDLTFEVAAVETIASGSAPVCAAPRSLTVPAYAFGDADVGRWIVLTGVPGLAPVQRVQIIGATGGVATLGSDVPNGTGTAWALKRLRIRTDLGPASEQRYFPTRERGLAWTLTRGGSTLIAQGTDGESARTDPQAALFRDRRITTIEATADAATALFAVVRNGVATLDAQLAAMDTSFLGVQTFDYST